jgi:uncharacterized membrane protein
MLCPWCMVTWVATIPTFLAVVLYTAKTGRLPLPRRLRALAAAAYTWVPAISVLCFVAIAVMAQVRLDVLASF